MNTRSISPPPLKRQKRPQPSSGIVAPSAFSPPITPTPGTLRIFSWNVNGIAPFVQPYLQESIKSFFGPAAAAANAPSSPPGRKRRRRSSAGEEAGVDVIIADSDSDRDAELLSQEHSYGDDDPSKEGEASLRKVLKRFGWPQILFLQEVKIKPGDDESQNAVRVAVNDARRPEAEGDAVSSGTSSNAGVAPAQTVILADGGPEYDVFFNLPADPYNAKGFGGKVYGVATIIRRDFMNSHVKEVRDVLWDREGRAQVIETHELKFPLGHTAALGSDTSTRRRHFAVFNIYAVNGTTNAYRSTHTGAPAGTRHDRKLAFHTDLWREARELESQGCAVVIAGDLNVAPDERDGHPRLRAFPAQHVRNRADFQAKFLRRDLVRAAPNRASYEPSEASRSKMDDSPARPGLGGLDTFRRAHGSERRYSHRPRGRPWGASCDRVDLVVVSRTLANDVVDAGICDSPRDRGPSDHCPVWVEIGPKTLGSGFIGQ